MGRERPDIFLLINVNVKEVVFMRLVKSDYWSDKLLFFTAFLFRIPG